LINGAVREVIVTGYSRNVATHPSMRLSWKELHVDVVQKHYSGSGLHFYRVLMCTVKEKNVLVVKIFASKIFKINRWTAGA
jgi:hypothetical protein